MKIVVNHCFGGFSISKEAAQFMADRGNKQAQTELDANKNQWHGYGYTEDFDDGYNRTDPDLVAAVETLGDKANGWLARLVVVTIPDDVQWELDEYDGIETVHEKHRSW